ncbi:hypothetical protein L7F22_025729 [Adiantum nelumboides]|nr:hypothetical protein [Adiantum nelumboides]
MSSIRLLISLASIFTWKLKQMDVNNAFLNGLLEEEEDKVCKLNKSLYRLKQAPRAWYGRIDDHLQSKGFQRSHADHTLYYKVQGKYIVLVILYVDDLILTESNEAMVEDVQSKLSKEFEMKDLGELHYILGIEVSRLKKGDIFISQQKYQSDLDSAANLVDRKSISGNAFFLGTGAISWSSKKQNTISLSSTEAEYIALTTSACEFIWLQRCL